jgi:hypothetical protein
MELSAMKQGVARRGGRRETTNPKQDMTEIPTTVVPTSESAKQSDVSAADEPTLRRGRRPKSLKGLVQEGEVQGGAPKRPVRRKSIAKQETIPESESYESTDSDDTSSLSSLGQSRVFPRLTTLARTGLAANPQSMHASTGHICFPSEGLSVQAAHYGYVRASTGTDTHITWEELLEIRTKEESVGGGTKHPHESLHASTGNMILPSDMPSVMEAFYGYRRGSFK